MEMFLSILFIELWPFGIIIPIIATVVLFFSRSDLIKFVPFVSICIWLIGNIILLWDFIVAAFVPERQIENPLGFSFEVLAVSQTALFAIFVFLLAWFFTWITHKILKKLNNKSK